MTNEEVRKLATLARLSLSDAECETYAKDFQGILAYVAQLEQIKGKVADGHTAISGTVKSDDTSSFQARRELVAQFPESQGDELRVPTVLSYGN